MLSSSHGWCGVEMRATAVVSLFVGSLFVVLLPFDRTLELSHAADADPARTIVGSVQNQDLGLVDQALVQVRDQEGNVVIEGVTNQAGEFSLTVPKEGIYSVNAIQATYRSEYAVVTVGKEKLAPVHLTLSMTREIALEIVSPLPPIQYKASSETYQLSRKDVE